METLNTIIHFGAMAAGLFFIVLFFWDHKRKYTPGGKKKIWRNIEPD